MGIIRNSINILGITPEEELPKQINGQIIEFSENDYIYIPENMPAISSIHKIEVKVESKPGRTINAPTGKIIVMDGIRKIYLTYVPVGYYQNYYTVNFELPFNTFIDLPNNAGEISSIETYIADAYFKMINGRKVYDHIIYIINVNYPSTPTAASVADRSIKITTLAHGDYDEESVVYVDDYEDDTRPKVVIQ